VNLPRLCESPPDRYAQAQKEHGDGAMASYVALFISFSHRFTSVEDLLKRESQLLHKYDEQTAHPESFQRISNLSGIRTQVKCRAYLSKNVLTDIHHVDLKGCLISFTFSYGNMMRWESVI
jgi:hypothetical protein